VCRSGKMCNSHVGVVKRIEVEKISAKLAELVQSLDEEVQVDVSDIRGIQTELEEMIKPAK
ncbi:MAG: hypothetical protein V4719_02765, partial [Planctomycetota bacterium]